MQSIRVIQLLYDCSYFDTEAEMKRINVQKSKVIIKYKKMNAEEKSSKNDTNTVIYSV